MENIFAFIDSQNLNLAIRDAGWQLDSRKFRGYLQDKYGVKRAYLFLGYVEGQEKMYAALKRDGYDLVFRPTLRDKKGCIKGNCDVSLTVRCMAEIDNFDKAIIVTGDGDFHCLIRYLEKKKKLFKIGIPNRRKYSALLRKFRKNYFFYVSSLKDKVEYKKGRG